MPRRLLGMLLALASLTGTAAGQPNPERDLPILIQKASPGVRKAWLEVEKLVRENEKRPNPLPEPYLARGEIWSQVNNYDEALADYLRATDLLFRQKPTLIDQARYLARIHETLGHLGKTPRPHFPDDASSYYETGRRHYFQGELTKALDYFNAAVQLLPQEPVFWYYRGLTLKSLGRDAEGERDVKVGASLVREAELNNSDIHKEVGLQLERVQGPLRNWMTDKARELPARAKK